MPLPPYSPELKVMETGWLYLKSHDLVNRIYSNQDALMEAGCDTWNRFTQDRQRVKSVGHAPGAESESLNQDWYDPLVALSCAFYPEELACQQIQLR